MYLTYYKTQMLLTSPSTLHDVIQLQDEETFESVGITKDNIDIYITRRIMV